MEDYKSNSHKSRELAKVSSTEERKKISKVVTGTVKTKKKSELGKFADALIVNDAKSVGSYLLSDVIIPGVVNTIEDIITKGIRMLLRGDTGKSNRSNASYVSYRQYSDSRDRHYDTSPRRNGYNYDDVILESRGEAEEVLSRMEELIDVYGTVSVADMYDLVGKTCQYTDNKYGWTNVRNAEPVRVRDGYMLKLPKALPID